MGSHSNIAEQEIWDQSYINFQFFEAKDAVTKTVDAFLDTCSFPENTSCFELGCFPGRYLVHFGKKYKFVVNGIDSTKYLDNRFIEYLKSEGVKVGTVKRADVFDYINTAGKTYDIVYSMGFIEHFEDYLGVLMEHDRLVAKGGLLIIFCPNFRGSFQYKAHKFFDDENLKIHVVPSMNPEQWAEELVMKGYEIISAGYYGGFDFWVGSQKRSFAKRFLLRIFSRVRSILKLILRKNSPSYSPYCGIIARKK